MNLTASTLVPRKFESSPRGESSHNRHVGASPQFGSTSVPGNSPNTADIAQLVSVRLGFMGITGDDMSLSVGMPRVVGFLDEAQQLKFTPTNSWHHQIYDGNKTPVAFVHSHRDSKVMGGWEVGAIFNGAFSKNLENALNWLNQSIKTPLEYKDIHIVIIPSKRLMALKFNNPDQVFQDSYLLIESPKGTPPKSLFLMSKAQLENIIKSKTPIMGILD